MQSTGVDSHANYLNTFYYRAQCNAEFAINHENLQKRRGTSIAKTFYL